MDSSKQIGDRTFLFGTIPPTESLGVQVAIARVIGEPLFKAFMEPKKTGSTVAESESAAGAAIGLMLSKIEATALIETMKTVFKYVSVDGVRVNIDSTFNGRNKEMWQVFIAALQFNFSDFLPEGLFASIQSKGATK